MNNEICKSSVKRMHMHFINTGIVTRSVYNANVTSANVITKSIVNAGKYQFCFCVRARVKFYRTKSSRTHLHQRKSLECNSFIT